MVAPDVPQTALKPMATLETSLEANYDRRTPHGQTKRLIGARATALPKKEPTTKFDIREGTVGLVFGVQTKKFSAIFTGV